MNGCPDHLYEAPSHIHGMGVFAARNFRARARVVEIDDSRIVSEACPDVDAQGQRLYYDDISGGRIVLLGPLQHTNHSCDFSTYAKTIHSVRYRIARRDIEAGEEITSHYSINARFGGAWECACGSAGCLTRIVHDFFALPRNLQMEYLALLDDWFIDENRGDIERVQAWQSNYHMRS